jgi:predicted aspartyl protease
VKTEASYDRSFEPPAPVVAVGVEGPAGMRVLCPMLIDTGADLSLLPEVLVHHLGLPQVDRTTVVGLGGGRRHATVHAGWLVLPGARILARLVAFADEAILGRDVLASLVVRLHGPRERVTITRR